MRRLHRDRRARARGKARRLVLVTRDGEEERHARAKRFIETSRSTRRSPTNRTRDGPAPGATCRDAPPRRRPLDRRTRRASGVRQVPRSRRVARWRAAPVCLARSKVAWTLGIRVALWRAGLGNSSTGSTGDFVELRLAFEHLNLRRNPFSVPETRTGRAGQGDFDELARVVRAGVAVQVVSDAGARERTRTSEASSARLPGARFVYVNEEDRSRTSRTTESFSSTRRSAFRAGGSPRGCVSHVIAVRTRGPVQQALRARRSHRRARRDRSARAYCA